MRCFGAAKSQPELTICPKCGGAKSWGRERCSACYAEDRRQIKGLVCTRCDKPLKRSPCNLKNGGRLGIFCGMKCFGLHVRGSNNLAYIDGGVPGGYGPGFKAAKRAVLAREEGACFLCWARDQKLDVHHVNRNKSDHSLANLAALCRACHNGQKGAPEEVRLKAEKLSSLLNARYGYQSKYSTLRCEGITTTLLTVS